MTEETKTSLGAKRPRRMAREPKADAGAAFQPVAPAPVASLRSKSSMVLELLARPEGATLDQLVEATGWLPHTTRAALTGLKKKGHALTNDKAEGGPRIYRVVNEAAQSSTEVDETAATETAV